MTVDRLFVNRKEKTNAGDWWSTPKHYFDEYKNDEWVDIFDLDKTVGLENYDQIIVGGGGLLFNDNFQKFIRLLEHPKVVHKVFYWAVGINDKFNKTSTKEDIEDNLYNFNHIEGYHKINTLDKKQINIRDRQDRYNIVPCASCLHPIFDEKIETERKFLIIKHNKVMSFNKHSFWRENKIISCIDNTIENIVTEIKKSEIVYTQSYHGAYWSALCGKKTIIYTPWSTKFLNCDFPVKVMARGEFLEVNYNEDIPEPDLNYLNECRTRNLKLYENINGLFR